MRKKIGNNLFNSSCDVQTTYYFFPAILKPSILSCENAVWLSNFFMQVCKTYMCMDLLTKCQSHSGTRYIDIYKYMTEHLYRLRWLPSWINIGEMMSARAHAYPNVLVVCTYGAIIVLYQKLDKWHLINWLYDFF